MVYTRKKARADSNPQSPPLFQHEINIREVPSPSRKAFTQEHNELFVQRIVQDAQVLEGGVLYYYILGLDESSTEDDLKNPIVNWLFDLTLKKISIHRLLLIFE